VRTVANLRDTAKFFRYDGFTNANFGLSLVNLIDARLRPMIAGYDYAGGLHTPIKSKIIRVAKVLLTTICLAGRSRTKHLTRFRCLKIGVPPGIKIILTAPNDIKSSLIQYHILLMKLHLLLGIARARPIYYIGPNRDHVAN
jgi:hypothetical protein